MNQPLDPTLVPDDDQILAAMAARPVEAWRELFTRLDALEPADLRVSWGGGGVQGGAVQAPYCVYSPAILEIQRALSTLNIPFSFDWIAWLRGRTYTAADVPHMSAPDAARLATAIIRSDRFSEGSIAQAIDSGVFVAILDRLRTWYEAERE